MADTPEPEEVDTFICTCLWLHNQYGSFVHRDDDCPLHGIDPDRAREDQEERRRLAREDRGDE
jgi:hypothetical protein